MAGNNRNNWGWTAGPQGPNRPGDPMPATDAKEPRKQQYANNSPPAERNAPSWSKPPSNNKTPAERNKSWRNSPWRRGQRAHADNQPPARVNNQPYGEAGRSSVNCEVGSQAESVPGPEEGRSEAYAPVLTAHRAPRPNPKFPGSKPASLSSLSPFNDDGDIHMGNMNCMSPQSSRSADIRHTIGLERDPSRPLQWGEDPFSEATRNKDYEMFQLTSFGDKLVRSWAENIPGLPNLRPFGHEEHWHCDVDTFNGTLREPIGYPETLPSNGGPKRENWNQLNWTASLLMRRYDDLSKKNSHFRSPVYDTTEDHMDEEALKKARDEATKQILARTPSYAIESPHIPCYLRPATAEDMAQVSAIYNWEMANGLQVLDSNPLSRDDFAGIFDRACKLHMPFLVAVHGHARKLGLNQGNLDYTNCIPHPGAIGESFPHFEGNIMGFAFFSVWEPGLTGSGNGSSRATAKVNLFVHPNHRRQRVGFSLLDKLLSIASSRYYPIKACSFVDATDSPIYKQPVLKLERRSGERVVEQERKYFRVYLDFHVRHKYYEADDPKLKEEQKDFEKDLDWARKLLDESFHFAEKVRYEQVFRKNRVWLDKVTFEHTCYLTDDMDGNEKY